MSELVIDMTFRDVIPPLTDKEFKELEKSIVLEGCRDPIITWNNIIIDGHHRYDICQENNIPFKVIKKDFSSKKEALSWMIGNQLGRRNLEDAQKIELALVREELQCNVALTSDKRKEIAKELNVGERNVAKVKKVLDKAPKEVKDKMRKGEISINKAHQEVSPKKMPPLSPTLSDPELLTTVTTVPPDMPEGYEECPHCQGTGQRKKILTIITTDSITCGACGRVHKTNLDTLTKCRGCGNTILEDE